jgi:predicted nucleotidyltransferase
MFGSCEVGYALKQSDIDLVLRIEDSKAYSLKRMEEVLKFFPWIL